MGKPKNKVVAGEEEARPSGGESENTSVKEEGNAEEGEAGEPAADEPVPVPVPVPVPKKRGRPRKVALKAEESNASLVQSAAHVEVKKPKAESSLTSPGRNGRASDVHPITSNKLSTRGPLRREGSRRKSEPRRAAD